MKDHILDRPIWHALKTGRPNLPWALGMPGGTQPTSAHSPARLMGARAACAHSPILHSYAGNAGAIRLYKALGFETRIECVFRFLRAA